MCHGSNLKVDVLTCADFVSIRHAMQYLLQCVDDEDAKFAARRRNRLDMTSPDFVCRKIRC